MPDPDALLPGPWWSGEPEPRTGRIMVISRPTATGVGIAFRKQEADLFAAGPELLSVIRELVQETVASGSSCDDPTLACSCFVCHGLRILAHFDGPGRCVICGCDEEHACRGFLDEPCGWADETRRICNRHPPEDIATARLVLAKEARRA